MFRPIPVLFSYSLAFIILLSFYLFFPKYIFAASSLTTEIEEQSNWQSTCTNFSQAGGTASCNNDMVTHESQLKKSGANSLVLKGTKTIKNRYEITLSGLKPLTKYKLSGWFKVEDRKCYNYIGLNYPDSMMSLNGMLRYTKGIWCGEYKFFVNQTGMTNTVNFLQTQWLSSLSIFNSDIDWFHEESYTLTTKDNTSLTFSIILTGFDGKLFMDGITLEEVESVIDDKYLHIPIDYKFQGMEIRSVSQNPLSVETNAGKFSVAGNQLKLEKQGKIISSLTFIQSNFLANMQIQRENGIVILENNNITLSIGADSNVIAKLKNDATISVEGDKPSYYSFEAGIIFATDSEKGMLFSPIYPPLIAEGMPSQFDNKIIDHHYNDSDFAAKGLKNWNIDSNFTNSTWKVSYTFKSGDGFITSLFPPKDFDEVKMCKEGLNMSQININSELSSTYEYSIQKFNEHANIFLLWNGDYMYSVNDQNPPTLYYRDADLVPVAPSDPKGTPAPFNPIDINGPVYVNKVVDPADNKSPSDRLKILVNQIHSKGGKAIIYITPEYYYTSDVDTFLQNVKNLLEEFDLDGVYFDGQYSNSVFKSLELVRKTRNYLKDKYYVQHSSWTRRLIKFSDHFRIPFLDVYADKLWVGENIKKVDDNTWKLNYCGQNVSNTASTILPELRPVNYAPGTTAEQSKALSLSPKVQIDNQLACGGEFRINSPYTYQSSILDKHFFTKIEFENDYYWNKLNNKCLVKTCGDNICDIGESIYSCPRDCAPVTNQVSLSVNSNTYSCNSNDSVAQWVVRDNPFYKLHFTFDGDIARDDSGNKMNPSRNLGTSYLVPAKVEIDGRKAYAFDNKVHLFGNHDETLDLTNKNFSSFAVIKRGNTTATKQVIFALNSVSDNDNGSSDNYIYYGINNSKLFVTVKDSGNTVQTYSGTRVIDGVNWHTIGIVYTKPNLRLYLDGTLEADVEIVLRDFPKFDTYTIGRIQQGRGSYFTGYIDDLFVTDKSLTSNQVDQYYRTQLKTITLSSAASCIVNIDGKHFTATQVSIPTPTPTTTTNISPTPSCPRKPQGDANCDGNIDGKDYVVWLNSQCHSSGNQTCGDLSADFNHDNAIDDADYNIWYTNRK